MKMFWKKKSAAYPREWIDDQSATMIWNELKQVSVCGRSDVTNAKVKKESTLRFERQQQKEEKSMAIKGSEKKMSRRVCWSTVRRAVHYRSFQLGSNCSHDFNLNRDDDGRISWLILLPILKEEGKRAKVVRNTQVVVVYLWRYDDDWFPLIWFDFIFLFINSQTRYAGKLGKLLVIE
jgi:hypothetical protein